MTTLLETAAGTHAGIVHLASLRQRGWDASRVGQYGQMRDAFGLAVREAEVLHAAAAAPDHEKSLLARSPANALHGRAVAYNHMEQVQESEADLVQAHALASLEGQGPAYDGIESLLDMIRTSRAHIWLESGQVDLAIHAYEASLAFIGVEQMIWLRLLPLQLGRFKSCLQWEIVCVLG